MLPDISEIGTSNTVSEAENVSLQGEVDALKVRLRTLSEIAPRSTISSAECLDIIGEVVASYHDGNVVAPHDGTQPLAFVCGYDDWDNWAATLGNDRG
ncbi:hypothetical protein BD779DRAFT_1801964 [Infundibulicybe gibba]|nr:hypothetical protein BD779DRAFT_1801964 [Infundibulicybe gibba]